MPIGQRVVTKYVKHPPPASGYLADGGPLDSGSAHIVHSNLSHLSERNVRLVSTRSRSLHVCPPSEELRSYRPPIAVPLAPPHRKRTLPSPQAVGRTLLALDSEGSIGVAADQLNPPSGDTV